MTRWFLMNLWLCVSGANERSCLKKAICLNFMTFFINACQPSLETAGYQKCRSSYRREIRYKYLTFLQQLNVTIILSSSVSKTSGIFLNCLNFSYSMPPGIELVLVIHLHVTFPPFHQSRLSRNWINRMPPGIDLVLVICHLPSFPPELTYR